jgi:hypothetical protein
LFSFSCIDLSKDSETIIKFRRDSYSISFGDESMFGSNEDDQELNNTFNRLPRQPVTALTCSIQ